MATTVEADKIIPTLKRYGITSASVFGSVARGDSTAKSDLDLLVTYAPGTTLFQIIDLQDELEAKTGRTVDLVSAKYIRPQLKASIKSDLIKIF